MKSLLFLTIIFLSNFSFSQKISLQEENINFLSVSNVNSILVEIPYANPDFIDVRIKKLLKSWGKHKESKGEHSSLMVEMKEMGKMPFNVYAKASLGNNENTRVNFGFDLGGAFLSKSEHTEKFEVVAKLITEFASDVVKDWISEELKSEEKILSQLQKDQKELEKRKEHLEKEIQDFNKKIAQNETEIKENTDLQGKKKESIAVQDKKVKKVGQKLKELN